MRRHQQNIAPPILIDTSDSLQRLMSRLLHQPHVAVDTESNSLYAYQEQVCLIQLSTPDADFLVDPLALDDLSTLGELMAAPGVEKVFHAAEYDIMCLRRDFNFEFASLFDTMVSVRILGWERVGLAAILQDEYGIELSKRYQRANWGARPLSPSMIRYAQMDTHFLLDLRHRLSADLERAGRTEEAREAFDELLQIGPHTSSFAPDGYWNINGAYDLTTRQLAILRELYLYRERIAKQQDNPPFKVMTDAALLRVARAEPGSLREMERIRGLSAGQIRRYGRDLLEVVRRGLRARHPPRRPDRPRRPHPDLLARYEALLTWRKERARKRGVESDVIMSKDALWELAKVIPRTPEQLVAITALGPWKRKTYGDEILGVLSQFNGVNQGPP